MSITDPQDEAMRTRLICSMSNEAVSRDVFKMSDDEQTFSKVVEVGVETTRIEDFRYNTVFKMNQMKVASGQKGTRKQSRPFPKGMCPRCDKRRHCMQILPQEGTHRSNLLTEER